MRASVIQDKDIPEQEEDDEEDKPSHGPVEEKNHKVAEQVGNEVVSAPQIKVEDKPGQKRTNSEETF